MGRCAIPRRYWIDGAITGAVNNAVTVSYSIDCTSVRRFHPEINWWRIQSLLVMRDANANMGCVLLDTFLADGTDQQLNLCVTSGYPIELASVLPYRWNGGISFNLTNRVGAAASYVVGIAVEPMFDAGGMR